jgi:hypothetical protein
MRTFTPPGGSIAQRLDDGAVRQNIGRHVDLLGSIAEQRDVDPLKVLAGPIVDLCRRSDGARRLSGAHAALKHSAEQDGQQDKEQLEEMRRRIVKERSPRRPPQAFLTSWSLTSPGGRSGGLGAPHAIVGETVREVAKGDLRPEFRSQSSKAIGAAAVADAAGDPDDDKGEMGEPIPAVHAGMFAFCSRASRCRADKDWQT